MYKKNLKSFCIRLQILALFLADEKKTLQILENDFILARIAYWEHSGIISLKNDKEFFGDCKDSLTTLMQLY